MQTRLCLQGPGRQNQRRVLDVCGSLAQTMGQGLMSRRARQGQNLEALRPHRGEKLLSCVSDGVVEWTSAFYLFIIFIFVYFLIVGFTESFVAVHGLFIAMQSGFPFVVRGQGNFRCRAQVSH